MKTLKIVGLCIGLLVVIWFLTLRTVVDHHAVACVVSVKTISAVSSKVWRDRTWVETVPTGETWYDPASTSWLPITRDIVHRDGFWEETGHDAYFSIELRITSEIGNGTCNYYCQLSSLCNSEMVNPGDELYCAVSRKVNLITFVGDMLGYEPDLNLAYTSLEVKSRKNNQ